MVRDPAELALVGPGIAAEAAADDLRLRSETGCEDAAALGPVVPKGADLR